MITHILNVIKGFLRLLYKCFWIFPQQKKIVLLSRQRNQPSVDFQLIVAELNENHPDYSSAVLCKELPLNVLGVLGYLPHLFLQLFHLATCSAVVVDGYVPVVSILKHRPNLVILQAWHALGAIKKFGYQALDTKYGHSSRIAQLMQMHEGYTHILCPGDASISVYCEAFNADEDKLLFIAPPYTERQLNPVCAEAAKERVMAEYPQMRAWEKERTVLYIPTFHGKIKGLCQLVEALLNAGYQVIFSRHPLDKINVFDPSALDSSLVERSYVENTTCSSLDLQHVAGHVISDYSATVLDAALVGTPFCFYVPDIESYRESPGLNLDPLIDFPSIASKDVDGVLSIINNRVCAKQALNLLQSQYLNHVKPHACSQIVEVLTKGEMIG